jgi:hypothetical protein
LVRRAAREIFRLRRLLAKPGNRSSGVAAGLSRLQREAGLFPATLRAGRAAARAMWKLTRHRNLRGPNEALLELDQARWLAWSRWLRRARRRPELIRGTTPVCGAWQFRCRLSNRRPALQLVVLEQCDELGRWAAVHRRYLIEFRSFAAAPRTRISREMNAPLDSPDRPLRLAIRGLGLVGVKGMELTDGVRTRRLRRSGGGKSGILGRPPPRQGFPELDWSRNQEEWRLELDSA